MIVGNIMPSFKDLTVLSFWFARKKRQQLISKANAINDERTYTFATGVSHGF